jgi:hypothetical protein
MVEPDIALCRELNVLDDEQFHGMWMMFVGWMPGPVDPLSASLLDQYRTLADAEKQRVLWWMAPRLVQVVYREAAKLIPAEVVEVDVRRL